MSKDEINTILVPASQFKSLKGLYVVWREESRNWYTNSTSELSQSYRCGKVAKKNGSELKIENWTRVPLFKCYVIPDQYAAKWEKWEDGLGFKSLDTDDFMSIFA